MQSCTMEEAKQPEDINKAIDTLKFWISKQPHLPQNIDDFLLRRFIRASFMSLEKAKKLLELNYTLRAQAPDLFDNRDPTAPNLVSIFKAIDFCPLPKKTKQQYNALIFRIRDTDVDKFAFVDALKGFFMMADLRMYLNQEDSEGEIPIFDMAGLSLRHLTKVTLPLVKKYMVFTQEAHPVRLRQIHVVNTSSYLDKCLTLVKPFMKSQVAKMLNFHVPNSSTLFDHVDREVIPAEYGGTLPIPLDEIKNDWYNKVMDNQKFFLDDSRWKLNEHLKPKDKQNGENMFGMQGSFRTLSID